MNGTRRSNRSAAGWIAALTLCGALGSAGTPAQAQTGRIGTVLGVPLNKLDDFRRANHSTGTDGYGHPVSPNDVIVLHVSPEVGAPINSAVATVSISQQGTSLKAWRVYFPQEADGSISPLYRYINPGDSFTNPRVLNGGVVQLDVRQPNTGDFSVEDVRFILIPIHRIFGLVRENPKARFGIVHAQQLANTFGVQLIAIDERSAARLRLPKPPSDLTASILALNTNISVGPRNLARVR
jgi:hypothetical protein